MKSSRLAPASRLLLALTLPLAAHGEENASTIKFSRPDQPGTVKVQIARGALEVRGTDTTEVTVVAENQPAPRTTRKDGLRVLTSSSGFSLTEQDNVVTLDASGETAGGKSAKFLLKVPRTTAVVVQNAWGGDIRCSGLGGDIEINNLNGSIRLEDVRGGVVVSTMNGEIHASLREVRDGKPLSFQSMNGEIVLRLAADAKASLRVRTQNGSVLTDFDETALVSKTQTASGPMAHRTQVVISNHTLLTAETRDAIREAARKGAEVAKEAAAAIREAVEAAREGAEAARHSADHPVAPPVPPRAPRPPKITTIPTVTGGKIVTGTLNGGGPEISIATMNGDVTLRQLENP